ncbi:MAG: hypothetical protein Q4F72_12850 [Desulfovibrionaceae bacterium]|nr:hypothetical protein [Desulfovibrionaceae bacterium]
MNSLTGIFSNMFVRYALIFVGGVAAGVMISKMSRGPVTALQPVACPAIADKEKKA